MELGWGNRKPGAPHSQTEKAEVNVFWASSSFPPTHSLSRRRTEQVESGSWDFPTIIYYVLFEAFLKTGAYFDRLFFKQTKSCSRCL